LSEWDKKRLEKLLNKKKEQEEQVEQILDEPDKKIIRRAKKRKLKRYNLSQTAKILDIPRQTLYYWIKKGWIKPKRDYRKYPVFTEEDVKKIKEWRDRLNEG
jgi:DNA-binding transcriptional MerR regulator